MAARFWRAAVLQEPAPDAAVPALARLLTLGQGKAFAYEQWFALTLLSGLSVLFLPRQFQVMVVENVDERHVQRAT